MKIVSWNCNGKFREKYKELLKLDCDVYIIQECESPILTKNKDYEKFASNFVYIEHSKHKGLGIFAKNNIKLKNNNWNSYGLECFCSVNINDIYDIIGVWCCGNYIEDYYVWQEIYKNKFHKNTIIFGDFNSNSIWDNLHDKRNHTQVVLNLNELGFKSIYHYLKKEKQGKETMPTFFQYRHLDKPYHIDYCFAYPSLIKSFKILDMNYLKFSDHLPILIEI